MSNFIDKYGKNVDNNLLALEEAIDKLDEVIK